MNKEDILNKELDNLPWQILESGEPAIRREAVRTFILKKIDEIEKDRMGLDDGIK